MIKPVRALLGIVAAVGIAAVLQAGAVTPVHAVNPADFDPGRIIDDELFYKKDDMSVSEIQAFLNAHVPACDTWGTGPSGYGNLTRAQYAQQIKGWHGPPYACLNNYHEDPNTGATSFERGGGAFPGGISAAQIIYDAAQRYGINPKVLLVTLRKEALNIYGDSWPLKSQYRYAMGYACPDSGPNYSAACIDSKAGFYNQMTLAAWQFRYYYDHMGSYNFAPGRWNTIQYAPNPSCGTKNVYIQNYATASLYIYTPYTPNNAALNAYPGQAYCGAYGNRNFWFMWQEWFGSTYAKATLESNLTLLSSVPGMGLYTNGFVEASFVVKNNTSSTLDLGTVAVACRDSAGANCDLPGVNIVLQPGQSYLYRQARNITKEDKYSFWITSYVGGQWNDSTPSAANNQIRRHDGKLVQHKPTLVQGVNVQGADIRIGGSYPVGFTVHNNSAFPLAAGSAAVGITSPSGKNADLKAVNLGEIPAGGSYIYSSYFTPKEEGVYAASILQTPNFVNWNSTNFFVPATGAVGGVQISTKKNPTVTESISLSPSSARVGDPVNVTLKMKNFANTSVDGGNIGAVIRDPNNQNADMSIRSVGQISAGGEYVAADTKTFHTAGTYTATPISYIGGAWVVPPIENTTKPAQVSFSIKPSVTLTQGLTIDNTNPYVGDLVTGKFKIKNHSVASASIDRTLCYIIRGPNSTNFDLGCMNIGTLAPGEEKVFEASRQVPLAGTYRAFFSMYDGAWHDNWTLPKETGAEPVEMSFTAKANPVLSQGLTMSGNLRTGDIATGTFRVRNLSARPIAVNKNLCYIIRGPNSTNFDLGCMNIGTLAPGEEKVFEASRQVPLAGTYRAFFSMYDGAWHDNWTFSQSTGAEPTELIFTAR